MEDKWFSTLRYREFLQINNDHFKGLYGELRPSQKCPIQFKQSIKRKVSIIVYLPAVYKALSHKTHYRSSKLTLWVDLKILKGFPKSW